MNWQFTQLFTLFPFCQFFSGRPLLAEILACVAWSFQISRVVYKKHLHPNQIGAALLTLLSPITSIIYQSQIYAGIMVVYATPNLPVAGVLSSLFFGIWNLFTGFLIGHQVASNKDPSPGISWNWSWVLIAHYHKAHKPSFPWFLHLFPHWILTGCSLSQDASHVDSLESDNEGFFQYNKIFQPDTHRFLTTHSHRKKPCACNPEQSICVLIHLDSCRGCPDTLPGTITWILLHIRYKE